MALVSIYIQARQDCGSVMVSSKRTRRDILLTAAIAVLCIVCFPANPLVLTNVLKTHSYPALFAVGCVVWAFGMVLVMAPIVMFPRRGGVDRGKSFVHTTRLVDSGIYAIVRHPQYTGGVLSIFVTTLLWYPHWLFGVLGVVGSVVIYLSCVEEEKYLVQQFGDEYIAYMDRVPRMNVVLGVIRLLRRRARSTG